MIEITNGTLNAKVTKGAFDMFFAKQGYEAVSDNKSDEDNLEWEENENDKDDCH